MNDQPSANEYTPLTDIEIGVLKLARRYGVDLDLSGPRLSRTVKAAARELLRKGYLTGTIKAVTLTVRGDSALPSTHLGAPHD